MTTPLLPIDRMLPNSRIAEESVLGSMMLNPVQAGSMALERLTEDHFYYASHQILFREIVIMQDALHAVDPVTLQQRLIEKKLLDEIGGPAYLMSVIQSVPSASNIVEYIEIVERQYRMRTLIQLGYELVHNALEDGENEHVWVPSLQQKILDIGLSRDVKLLPTTTELVDESIRQIAEEIESGGKIMGVPTGFRDIDDKIRGFRPGQFVVIAARPAMGKSSLAMNIAEHVATVAQKSVGVFSLEMSGVELVKRSIASLAEVNLREFIKTGYQDSAQFGSLVAAGDNLKSAQIVFDDTPAQTVSQVRAKARRWKLLHGIELLIIDYLGLMRSPSKRGDANRQQEMSDISQGIKALAKELHIPVIGLCQLNRNPEGRKDGRPRLSDLRESGSLEQDADIVGLIHRQEEYEEDYYEKEKFKGKAVFIIAKQRNGPTGDVPLTWRKEYTKFADAAREGTE